MALDIACVTSRAVLGTLQPEWDALWSSLPDRTPFQHTAWLFPWCDVFGHGAFRVVTFRDGEQLVGILPLYASPAAAGTELRLLGAGISDYLDMLVAPGAEAAVLCDLPVAFECVGEWSFCGLDHLREGSLLLQCGCGRLATDSTRVEEPSAVMDLPASVEELPEHLGAKLASNLRNRKRRAERIGPVTVETASGSTLSSALTALFALHATRWARVEQAGVLADPAVCRFHRVASDATDRAGLLRVSIVRVAERVAAVQYGFQVADRAYLYIGGFDPALSEISPGKLSILAVVERAIADGAVTLDFLGGREAYKYEWGATDRPRCSRHLRRTSHGAIAADPHLPA